MGGWVSSWRGPCVVVGSGWPSVLVASCGSGLDRRGSPWVEKAE